jgi:hypothetical protein
MLFEGRANPVTMVAEIERMYRATRRSYRIAFWCAVVQVGLLAYTLSRLVWP